MTKELFTFWVAFLGGVALTLGLWLVTGQDLVSPAEKARIYDAYRVCIQRSDCIMTPQDWIDYYELKWEIEGDKPDE